MVSMVKRESVSARFVKVLQEEMYFELLARHGLPRGIMWFIQYGSLSEVVDFIASFFKESIAF